MNFRANLDGPIPLSPTQTGRIRAMERSRAILDRVARLTPRIARPGPIRRIGVLLQWGIGDAVLTLPLLRALHLAHPEASIEPIGKGFLPELLGDEPGIGPCHRLVPPWVGAAGKYRIWERSWREYLRDLLVLRKIDFDLLIAPRCDPRDSIQTRLLTARSVAGFAAAGGQNWFTIDAGVSVTDIQTRPRNEVMAALGNRLTSMSVDPVPHLTHAPSPDLRAMLKQQGYLAGPILGISFGAAHPIRRWDPAKISEILGRVAAEVGFFVIVSEPGPASLAFDLPDGTPNMIWQADLKSTKSLLAEIDILFCADSGLMHVAAALGTAVVAVFGPGSLTVFGPSGANHRMIAIDPMPCRPCYDACIYSSPLCLDQITPDDVVPVLQSALRSIA